MCQVQLVSLTSGGEEALKERMEIIPALGAFVPAGHYCFKLLSSQLCLTSLQLYHGTVLFAEKTETRFSIDIIYIEGRSPSVSNFLQGRFLMTCISSRQGSTASIRNQTADS